MKGRRFCFAVAAMIALAQPAGAENLDAGKTPGQIFASTCAACHRGSRGLVKSVSPSALPGFLREHYTTGSSMAAAMSAFLIAGGGGRAGVIPSRESASVESRVPAPQERPEVDAKQRQASAKPVDEPESSAKSGAKRRPQAADQKDAGKDSGKSEKPEAPKGQDGNNAAKEPEKTEVAAVTPADAPVVRERIPDIGAKPGEMPIISSAESGGDPKPDGGDGQRTSAAAPGSPVIIATRPPAPSKPKAASVKRPIHHLTPTGFESAKPGAPPEI